MSDFKKLATNFGALALASGPVGGSNLPKLKNMDRFIKSMSTSRQAAAALGASSMNSFSDTGSQFGIHPR
jgi:hypothetical protein